MRFASGETRESPVYRVEARRGSFHEHGKELIPVKKA